MLTHGLSNGRSVFWIIIVDIKLVRPQILNYKTFHLQMLLETIFEPKAGVIGPKIHSNGHKLIATNYISNKHGWRRILTD